MDRRLGGGAYGPRFAKKSDATERLVRHNSTNTHTHTDFSICASPNEEEGKSRRILLYISSITAFITRLQLLIAQLTHYHIRHRRAGIMSSCPSSLAEHWEKPSMIVQGVNSNLPLFEAKPELVKWHLDLQPNLPFLQE